MFTKRTELNQWSWIRLKRCSKLNYMSVAVKYALSWQPRQHTEHRAGKWGVAELSECQDAQISGEQSCDDIRAV